MNSLLHTKIIPSKPAMLNSKAKPFVQAKLTVNEPGDIYEQEADAMADRVMRMSSTETAKPVTGLIGKSLQRRCAHCEEEEKKKKPVMRKAEAGNSGISVSSSFASSLNASKGGGSPLPQGTRSFMESAFSADFSGVRVHTGNQASEMSKGINAKAFTYGNDIYFNEGQYNPVSSEGKHLLAHELTHTVQQGDNIKGEKIQRVGPAAAAGIAFGAGVVIGALTFEAALDYARSLSTLYPGWLSVLPNCPCSESTVLAASSTWVPDANPALSWFHPGAASSYRSSASYSSVPGSSHGQQCTYNSSGELITYGPGAGTPDVWSPNTNQGQHFLKDAATWQVLGWRIYNSFWRPNNGNGCPANNGENTFMRRVSEFLP
jgi:hypothetical protein